MSARDPISLLHDDLVGWLRPYFPAGAWQIEPVPAPLTLNEFRALVGRTPWIGISWAEFKLPAGTTRALNGDQSFRLTVCVKNPGRGARFLGDRKGPGLYPALCTVASVLHGQTITGTGTLLVTRLAQVFADGYADDTIAIGAVDVACNTALGDWLGDAATAPAFARLVSAFELAAPDGSTQPIASDTNDLPVEDAP